MRLTTAPDDRKNDEMAHRLVADLSGPERGAPPLRGVSVEAPNGALVQDPLSEHGWSVDEPWTPLRRDLTEPVEYPGVSIEVIALDRAHVSTAVHRASFGSAQFTDERALARHGGRRALCRRPVPGRV